MQRDAIHETMVVSLKIAVVTPYAATVEQVRGLLERWDGPLSLTPVTGGVDQAARAAEQAQPDVLIVEGVRHDAEELALLERIAPRHPAMAIVLLSPNQSPQFLRHGMRIGLREILPLPLSGEALFETMGRISARIAAAHAPKRSGKILCFVGCKGGSGATFIAANLAYALAEGSDRRVALIDLNAQFGDAVLHVSERQPGSDLGEVARQVHRLDASLLASSMVHVLPNCHVLAAPEEPDQALHVRPEQIDALLWVAASSYDVVVVDAGRSLDQLTVRAMDKADAIYAVMQLTLPSVRNARRLLRALHGLGYGPDKVKVVVNRYEKKGEITVEDAATALRQPVFRTVPNSYGPVTASVNQGVPVAKLAPRDAVSRALRDMAADITATRKEGGGWLARVLAAR